MALRLIEIVLKKKDGEELLDLLKEHDVLEYRQVQLLNDEVLARILLEAEQSEVILELLKKQFLGRDNVRLIILPVEATIPRAEPEATVAPTTLPSEEKTPERIGREELY